MPVNIPYRIAASANIIGPKTITNLLLLLQNYPAYKYKDINITINRGGL